MNANYTTQNNLLLSTLNIFYQKDNNIDKMLSIINELPIVYFKYYSNKIQQGWNNFEIRDNRSSKNEYARTEVL